MAAPLGSPGGKLVGPVLYGVGRLTGSRDIARTGLHTTEAVLITTLITDGIKIAAGRSRPSLSPDDPYDFRLMGGLEGNAHRSFPSGHASASFAVAAAVTAEVGYSVRGSRTFVAPILFGTASAVGLSRMYDNQHWGSDVIVGAALGTLVGYKVARYTHQHPGNTLDTALLGRDEGDPSETAAPQRRPSRGAPGVAIPITVSIPAP